MDTPSKDSSRTATSSWITRDKMKTLEVILKHDVDIVCGESVIDICEQYHNALETIAELCHTDPNFSHIMCGSGFEGLPVLFHLREVDAANANLQFAQPQPIQKVLYVHRHSVVLQDLQTHWKRKCPLLYYMAPAPCTQPDRVKVSLSARTHSHMLKGSFGIAFSESSTRVLPDELLTFKFYLSAQGFLSNFEEQCSSFLISYKPILGWIKRRGEGEDEKEANIPGSPHDGALQDPTSETYAVKNIPALFCPDWPLQAMAWVSRKSHSGWPSRILSQEVIAKGCHVIPVSMSKQSKTDQSTTNEDCEWMLCFEMAEKHLFQSLGRTDKQVAFLFRSLVCDRHSLHRGLITMEHINAVLLWTYHDCKAVSKESDSVEILHRFLQVVRKFMECLTNGRCQHFFIPEKDLFANIPENELENIRDMVDGLLEQPWTFLLHCHLLPYVVYPDRNQMETIFYTEVTEMSEPREDILHAFTRWAVKLSQSAVGQVQQSLVKSFEDNVNLFVLTSCSRMNQYSLSECIILHRDIFRILEEATLNKKFLQPFIEILKSNLGCLYHVQSMSAGGIRAKQYFLEKAEALFRASRQMDYCLGRSRLSTLLFATHRYPEAIAELEEIIQLLTASAIQEISNNVEDDVQSESEDQDADEKISVKAREMKVMLWRRWLKRSYLFDIAYSKTLRPMCPQAMRRCLRLVMCTTLGIQNHSAAVFSPNFHSRFLMALCHLNMRGDNRALSILRGMETVLTDPNLRQVLETSIYSELNEKRIAGYLIILGNCYLLAGDREKAKAMYQRSLKIFPSPRNAASWLYLRVQYGDTWQGIQQGAKILAVASALSVAFSFIHSHI